MGEAYWASFTFYETPVGNFALTVPGEKESAIADYHQQNIRPESKNNYLICLRKKYGTSSQARRM